MTYHMRPNSALYKGAKVVMNRPLTDSELLAIAPTIFAPHAHDARSERYAFYPTSELVINLRNEGFEPFAVAAAHVREKEGQASREGFQKAMIRFRHRRHFAEGGNGMDFAREVIVFNAHDGTSSVQLMAGGFETVCKNCLFRGTIDHNVRVPHKGDIRTKVIEGAYSVLESLGEMEAERQVMRALPMSPREQHVFAEAAQVLRWSAVDEDGKEVKPPVTTAQLLQPRFREQVQPTLWNTFQTVQNHVINGGDTVVQATARGQRRTTTRQVTGIDQTAKLNQALWLISDHFMREKARAAA
jgi:Domain of unknown function (DUF932)